MSRLRLYTLFRIIIIIIIVFIEGEVVHEELHDETSRPLETPSYLPYNLTR